MSGEKKEIRERERREGRGIVALVVLKKWVSSEPL
jgi:hypothetical protein